MIPPTSIDGTDITGATIDGTDVQEITVDGDTVFELDQLPTSNLVHRYSAKELSLNDNDPVSTFSDAEGSDDLSASGSPTFKTNLFGNKPGVRYDGNDDEHQGSFTSAVSQPFSIFMALDIRSVSTSQNEGYFWDTGTQFGPRLINNKGDYQIADDSGSKNGGAPTTGRQILSALFDGANTKLRINGVDEITKSGSGDISGFYLASSPFDQYAQIDIASVLVYDAVPTVSDVENYLSVEYSISI